MKAYEINEALARKVLSVVDAGLVNGMGLAAPGHMCVEAAVCYALGIAHSDEPPCVGAAVRRFKINLNDSQWSSDAARTKGMRLLAIAQLGSDTIDQRAFADMVIVGVVRRILPIALQAAAERAKEPHKAALLGAIPACEAVTTRAEARQASLAVRKAAAAYAAADAAAAADSDADAARDRVLNLAAEIGLDALKALNSPGCAYLYLAEA